MPSPQSTGASRPVTAPGAAVSLDETAASGSVRYSSGDATAMGTASTAADSSALPAAKRRRLSVARCLQSSLAVQAGAPAPSTPQVKTPLPSRPAPGLNLQPEQGDASWLARQSPAACGAARLAPATAASPVTAAAASSPAAGAPPAPAPLSSLLANLPNRARPEQQAPAFDGCTATAMDTAAAVPDTAADTAASSRLHSMVMAHLRAQHEAACAAAANPISTLAPISLLEPHTLPEVWCNLTIHCRPASFMQNRHFASLLRQFLLQKRLSTRHSASRQQPVQQGDHWSYRHDAASRRPSTPGCACCGGRRPGHTEALAGDDSSGTSSTPATGSLWHLVCAGSSRSTWQDLLASDALLGALQDGAEPAERALVAVQVRCVRGPGRAACCRHAVRRGAHISPLLFSTTALSVEAICRAVSFYNPMGVVRCKAGVALLCQAPDGCRCPGWQVRLYDLASGELMGAGQEPHAAPVNLLQAWPASDNGAVTLLSSSRQVLKKMTPTLHGPGVRLPLIVAHRLWSDLRWTVDLLQEDGGTCRR